MPLPPGKTTGALQPNAHYALGRKAPEVFSAWEEGADRVRPGTPRGMPRRLCSAIENSSFLTSEAVSIVAEPEPLFQLFCVKFIRNFWRNRRVSRPFVTPFSQDRDPPGRTGRGRLNGRCAPPGPQTAGSRPPPPSRPGAGAAGRGRTPWGRSPSRRSPSGPGGGR